VIVVFGGGGVNSFYCFEMWRIGIYIGNEDNVDNCIIARILAVVVYVGVYQSSSPF
jgi:hypothetical protein